MVQLIQKFFYYHMYIFHFYLPIVETISFCQYLVNAHLEPSQCNWLKQKRTDYMNKMLYPKMVVEMLESDLIQQRRPFVNTITYNGKRNMNNCLIMRVYTYAEMT